MGLRAVLAIGIWSLIWVKPVSGFAQNAKKTVCTITINSTQEKELFRKKLPSSEFRMIELIPEAAPGLAWIEGWSGANWFRKACEQRVQCDILVISGHFAGTFFGKSSHSLSLNEMEKASCQASCDGIFKRPKEVYLFGCNTLADKTKDHRGPEDYVEVLRADGFSVEEAQSIALQRYTPWGASTSDRMRSLFPNATGLYGFTSTSPLGKHIEAPLARYLESRSSVYAKDLDGMKMGDRNTELAKALSAFSFRQAEVATHASQALVCRMTQQSEAMNGSTLAADLKLISAQLHSEEPLKDLPQILERLRLYSAKAGLHIGDIGAAWSEWKTKQQSLRERLAQMSASDELKAHFVVRLGLLELRQFLATPAEVKLDFEKLMRESLKKLGAHRAQEICAQRASQLYREQRLPADLVVETAKQAGKGTKFRERVFGALSCLEFQTSTKWLMAGYPDSFLYSQDWTDSQSALLKLLAASPGSLSVLIPLLTEQPMNPDVRAALSRQFQKPASTIKILQALRNARRMSEEATLAVIDLTRIGSDEEVKSEWIGLWRSLRPSSPLVQKSLFDHARRAKDPSSWLAILSGVELHPDVKKELMEVVQDPRGSDRRFILNLLARLTRDGDGLYPLALQSAKDADPAVRAEAIDLLARHFWEAFDLEIEPVLLKVLQEDNSIEVLDEALHFWAKRGTRDLEVLTALDQVWSRSEELSELRTTSTEVLSHLNVQDASLVDLWFQRLQKAPAFSETEAQLLQMLSSASWQNSASKDALIVRFMIALKSDEPRGVGSALKAILRNANPEAAFLEKASRQLEAAVEDQNWMSARELAFELQRFKTQTRVAKALKAFEVGIDNSLDGEI